MLSTCIQYVFVCISLYVLYSRTVNSSGNQQYNVGEKPTIVLYTYINRHAGTPDKKQMPSQPTIIQPSYMCLLGNKLRTYLQIRTTKAERFAVETHHFEIQHAEIIGRR